jgi:hypothetical protein
VRGPDDFDVDDVGVAHWSPFDGVHPLVAHPLVEAGRLETVCCEHDLSAAPSGSFSLGKLKEFRSETSPSVPLVHPDVRQLATTAPRMPVETRDDVAGIIPDAAGEQHPIVVSGRLRIELVDAICQERSELLAFAIISARNEAAAHGGNTIDVLSS